MAGHVDVDVDVDVDVNTTIAVAVIGRPQRRRIARE
jgi:hypothetical protein